MDPKLLEILVCPITKGPLKYHPQTQELHSRSARLAYPVRDGIPVLLEDQARPLSDEELNGAQPSSTASTTTASQAAATDGVEHGV